MSEAIVAQVIVGLIKRARQGYAVGPQVFLSHSAVSHPVGRRSECGRGLMVVGMRGGLGDID